MDPALEGAVLSFDCPPQYVLVGPTTTTCMGNGEWEPDPREVKCNGNMMLSVTTITSFLSCATLYREKFGNLGMRLYIYNRGLCNNGYCTMT